MGYLTIGEAIRKERKGKKITGKRLASMVNCSEQAISQYERGVRPLKTEMLYSIAEALSVPVETLLPKDGAQPIPLIAVITDREGEVVAAIPMDGGDCMLNKDYTLRFCADKDLSFEPVQVAPDKSLIRCRIEEQATHNRR